ncbi:unknown [Salmonella phage FelixO1]|uniref:Uncharacterized protein n=1 Tax=Salmonella phage Felix O1 (isolate Felix O1-VT1) TaxID=1283336 RepID=Q6KGU0_BPFO1|nr:unknown [Salmonella phage FelixO1]
MLKVSLKKVLRIALSIWKLLSCFPLQVVLKQLLISLLMLQRYLLSRIALSKLG